VTRRLSLTAVLAVALLATSLGALRLSAASAAAKQNYTAVVSQFMCTGCHEPLELVSSPEAQAEKKALRGLINQGLGMAQIKRAMVAQYGVQVLGKPPASGFNLSVYIVPPAVFLGGLALLVYTLPKWRRRSREAALTRMQEPPDLPPDEAQRLDDELSNFI
jgi:cytochrome c-type biogenesis protein CcmH/NrfF